MIKCVSRAPNWNKQPFANDRKMSWEGHSISVNHGRQITSFRKILPSRKRRKPPPPGMLACATPFSMLGANGDDLAKHMMVVLYWHDRPHSKYHHPRLAWRFSFHCQIANMFGCLSPDILHHWLCTHSSGWLYARWKYGNGLQKITYSKVIMFQLP